MSKNAITVFQLVYSISILFIIGGAIKATQSIANGGGISMSDLWTKESYYYLALASFIINIFGHHFDEKNRYLYLIILGFSFIFFPPLIFQLTGISILISGLIFQFLSQQRP